PDAGGRARGDRLRSARPRREDAPRDVSRVSGGLSLAPDRRRAEEDARRRGAGFAEGRRGLPRRGPPARSACPRADPRRASGPPRASGRTDPVTRTSGGVLPGIDRLLADPSPIAGRRVGLITNPSGVTAAGVPTWRALFASKDVALRRL